jgi:hypothetical protein
MNFTLRVVPFSTIYIDITIFFFGLLNPKRKLFSTLKFQISNEYQ